MNYDLTCIGMALVDSIIRDFDPVPVTSTGYKALSGSLNVGGEAVNEAIAAAKLGLKTRILCGLGQDIAGEIILNSLKKHGVDTELTVRSPQTPVTTMFVSNDGNRKSIINEAHKYNFHPEKYNSAVRDSRALLLGSLFRAPFDDPNVLYSVAANAREAGRIVIADTKLNKSLGLRDIAASLPLIDYITPNEDEAEYLTNKADPDEIADVFLNYGIKNVIIKLGAKGCYFKNGNEKYMIPGCKINAVDATGAGDNFIAGFVSEILRGAKTEDALIFANACGAICTTAIGADTALRDRDQVLQWIVRSEGKFF